MPVYGRRRCCAGVYMLDAENFESIVAELKSEHKNMKLRSRGQCTNSANNHTESRPGIGGNSSAAATRKAHDSDSPLKSGVHKSEKCHNLNSRRSSTSEYLPKGHSIYSDERLKPESRSSDEKAKPRGDVLNNKRGNSSPKAGERSSNRRRSSESDYCSDPPITWIKNNLATTSGCTSRGCKSCEKELAAFGSTTGLSSSPPPYSSNTAPLPCSPSFVHPSIVCSQSGASSLHSLIHYTTGKPILLYDYSEENCPVCQRPQRKHGQSRAAHVRSHGESTTQRSFAQPSSHAAFSYFSKPHNHHHHHHHHHHHNQHSCFTSTVPQPSDCLDINSKNFSHSQVNLTCSHFDPKSSIDEEQQLDVSEENGLIYDDDPASHPASTPTSKSSGSCLVCSQSRCSQCTWSQLFYDSYYRVYFMYPQQNPFGMANSVFLDLTDKNYTISVERPYLGENEVHNLLKTVNNGHSSSTLETSYYQPHPEYGGYEDPLSSAMWSTDQMNLPTPFPSGPIVCISMPNVKRKLRYSNASLVPPLSFAGYCGSAPPDRSWRPLCEPVQGAIQFTLMCYNILCEKYASQQVYPYCPTWALNWVYRRAAILDEIRLYTADIICLQEVEMDQYELHFEKLLKTHGYSGIFSPKSRAHHMTDAERRKVDGCAIFWKTERFRLVKDTVIEFSRMAMERYENDCKESPEMLNRVMVRDNIALSAILETKESSQPQQFMVSTAHIHWDPEYSDVKLIQSIMHVSSLYQKIEEHLLEQNGGKTPVYPANMPLIVCGDFNSLPESGVVEFLTQGRVAKSHPDFKNLGYVKVLDKLCGRRRHGRNNAGDADVLQHDFVLGRAYDSGEGMRYTNYTYDFKGIIDYIFYTKNHFNVLGNLEMVNESWLKKEKIPGCPHPHIPSDHFPLLVELELQLPSDHHTQHSRK